MFGLVGHASKAMNEGVKAWEKENCNVYALGTLQHTQYNSKVPSLLKSLDEAVKLLSIVTTRQKWRDGEENSTRTTSIVSISRSWNDLATQTIYYYEEALESSLVSFMQIKLTGGLESI